MKFLRVIVVFFSFSISLICLVLASTFSSIVEITNRKMHIGSKQNFIVSSDLSFTIKHLPKDSWKWNNNRTLKLMAWLPWKYSCLSNFWNSDDLLRMWVDRTCMFQSWSLDLLVHFSANLLAASINKTVYYIFVSSLCIQLSHAIFIFQYTFWLLRPFALGILILALYSAIVTFSITATQMPQITEITSYTNTF